MAKRKSKKPSTPKLTDKQRRLVQNIAQGMPRPEAAVAAGYSPGNPRQSAHQALEGIRAKMSDVLDRHGLTEDHVIDKYLLPLLSANISKFFAHEGKVVTTKQVEDNETRRQTLHMYFNLKGSYAPKTQEEAGVKQSFLGPTVIILDMPRPKRPAAAVPTKAQD